MSSSNGNTPHMLDAALAYAAAGLQVAACAPRSKVPLSGTNGVYSFTTDAAQLQEWWRRYPNRNVAAAIPQGYVVLDLDGPEAVQWWLDQVGQHEALFTKTAKSSRGQHLWFRVSVPIEHRAALVEGQGWHVEVRTPGGRYMVMPPSVHPDGPTYSWLDDRPAAEAPPWLVGILTGTARGGTPGGPQWDGGSPIPEGRRHDVLVAAAGRMRHLGMSSAGVEQALADINAQWCLPPVELEELGRIAGSTETWQEPPPVPPRVKIQATEDGMPPDAPLRNVGEHVEPDFGRPRYGGRIVLVEPPIYRWTFEGTDGELELSSLQMEAWPRVRRAFLERYLALPNWSPPGKTQADREQAWMLIVRNWLQVATRVEAPEDLTVRGVVTAILEKFLQRAHPESDVLLRGGVWWDGTDYVFKTSDLLNQARAEWPPEWRTQRSAAIQTNEVLREHFDAYERFVHVPGEKRTTVRSMAIPAARIDIDVHAGTLFRARGKEAPS